MKEPIQKMFEEVIYNHEMNQCTRYSAVRQCASIADNHAIEYNKWFLEKGISMVGECNSEELLTKFKKEFYK